jgi:hypothetical protein
MSGPNEGNRKAFGEWTTQMGLPHETALPPNERELQVIFLRLAELEDKHVRACLLYNGAAKQDMEFEGGENYEVSQSDEDTCGC